MRPSGLLPQVFESIDAIDPVAWDRCFPGDPEGWAFYKAIEDAGPPGFQWRYLAILEAGVPLAVVPAFLTEYRLDTTVPPGSMKRLLAALTAALPSVLTLRLASLGSPVAETCHLGFVPEVPDERKPFLVQALLAAFEGMAAQEGCSLLGVKDVPDAGLAPWHGPLAERGFQRMPGLPTATLAVPAGGLDAYLATLSRATRKDMRRKLRDATLRIEHRQSVDDVLPRIADLYEQTFARGDLTFERLPPAYFAAVLARMPTAATMILYWADDDLVAFNLVLEGEGRLIDKYVGMDNGTVRQHNLYFVSWLHNVALCSECDLPVYQSGQSFYAPKVRLGSRLSINWLYFRHRNTFANYVLGLVAKLVRLDRFDPEIARLMEETR
ncbi:GNAT family N-acetyltransferase [Microvirga puerhi]|uniref:GNAT family N-acetyltransferase n=1 Tax=Microvirga puerhi TaxID=2876078 RepID=A0ABS7VUR8_9HYPH|nr:GNAT family N-acetyltransferase [Microvirga puerhi]MBZ6078865.1 GNAT family N-acetyltransferase [Microvirga puerhi]